MDREQLKRGGQVLAPSLFTMGNMACGFYSLLASNAGDYHGAATAILAGIVMDMLDGRVARIVHGESSFGVEFDSLSDFLTFGVAPAYMMWSLSLKDLGPAGGVLAFVYALCGGLRLARFNAVAQAGSGSKTHFQGLPIPAGAGLLASCVLLYVILEQQRPARTLPFLMDLVPRLLALSPFLMLLLAFLMVSSIPYAAFKQPDLLGMGHPWRVAMALLALAGIYFYPENSIFVLFLAYVLSGFAGMVLRRRRSETRPGSVPPQGTSVTIRTRPSDVKG